MSAAESEVVANEALTLQLLAWVAAGRRTYGETMDAWRTTCPRMPIWEDAVSDGLVERLPATRMDDCEVRLTAAGHTRLRQGR